MSLRPNTCTDMVHGFCGERGSPAGEGKGPWQRNAILVKFE